MGNRPIGVSGKGAILLGTRVVCDGFHYGSPTRVQTHIHQDHMVDFATSKGNQKIVLTEPTGKLIAADFSHADMPFRTNVQSVNFLETIVLDDQSLTLFPSEHMLGAAQVMVEMQDGMRLGYSGDFSWPLTKIPELDMLVLDATCGKPMLTRSYTQESAEKALVDITLQALNTNPVYIKAFRGTIQRAIELLSHLDFPILASPRLLKEIGVYCHYGYNLAGIINAEEDLAQDVMDTGRFIRLFSTGDRLPIETSSVTSINLNAYVSGDIPLQEHSRFHYTVALSNHADFNETLEYVRATGAKFVLTDSYRSHHAEILASEIRSRLGVAANASSTESSSEWGA